MHLAKIFLNSAQKYSNYKGYFIFISNNITARHYTQYKAACKKSGSFRREGNNKASNFPDNKNFI
jgi:hypothetical protein